MYIMWIREITGPERVIFEGVAASSKQANYIFNCVYKAHREETVLEYQLLENWRIDHVLKGLENIV